MIKSKPIHLFLSFLALALFMTAVLPSTPVFADHGGWHAAPDSCDSVSEADQEACQTRKRAYYGQVVECGDNEACKDRALERWQAWLAAHAADGGGEAPTYDITEDDTNCAAQEKLSLDWDINNDGCSNTADLITMIFRVLAGIVGIAVVGGITWGGMLYASSNGNASKAQQGITVIVNAVIGLLLFIFMFAITNFLVPGGVIG